MKTGFKEILLEDIMVKDVLIVAPEENVTDICRSMKKRGAGSAVVTDRKRSFVMGIFTERDLLNRVAARGKDPAETSVSEVMSAPVKYLSPKATFADAFYKVYKENIRHLPIIDDGKLVGMVSVRDLNKVFFHELGRLLFGSAA